MQLLASLSRISLDLVSSLAPLWAFDSQALTTFSEAIASGSGGASGPGTGRGFRSQQVARRAPLQDSLWVTVGRV